MADIYTGLTPTYLGTDLVCYPARNKQPGPGLDLDGGTTGEAPAARYGRCGSSIRCVGTPLGHVWHVDAAIF